MRLLTHNMLQCPRTKAYPLTLRATTCDDVEVPFSEAFIKRMLPRLDWKVFLDAAQQLPDLDMLAALPEAAPGEDDQISEDVLRAIHRALMEWHVVDGFLETEGARYVVKNGIPNLVITEVRRVETAEMEVEGASGDGEEENPALFWATTVQTLIGPPSVSAKEEAPQKVWLSAAAGLCQPVQRNQRCLLPHPHGQCAAAESLSRRHTFTAVRDTMWRFLQNTTLGRQLREISEARRALRIAEHRASLRLKRAAVRSRVMLELHKGKIEHAVLQMERARSIARMQAAREVLQAHEKRREKMAAVLAERGAELPPAKRPVAENSDAAAFKRRIVEQVEKLMPASAGGVAAGRIAREALRESVDRVGLDERRGDVDMGVGLVAGLAKEIGVSREELAGLIEHVERDGGDVGLRGAVLDAIDERERQR